MLIHIELRDYCRVVRCSLEDQLVQQQMLMVHVVRMATGCWLSPSGNEGTNKNHKQRRAPLRYAFIIGVQDREWRGRVAALVVTAVQCVHSPAHLEHFISVHTSLAEAKGRRVLLVMIRHDSSFDILRLLDSPTRFLPHNPAATAAKSAKKKTV